VSKLLCKCGHIISNTDYPSLTEGMILREKVSESFFEEIGKKISEFFHERINNNEAVWLKKNLGEDYPVDATVQEVVQDLVNNLLILNSLSVSECAKCGRLHVQGEPKVNEYFSYIPDSGKANSILST